MIKANELKLNDLNIGNYVKCKVSNDAGIYRILKIDGLHLKIMLDGAREGIFYDLNKIKPIPLTPKLLLKCKFEKVKMGEIEHYYIRLSESKYCDLNFINGDKNGFLEVCLFPYQDDFRYQYLHQLQNAFFGITRNELKINL